jgi:hypothetical protein
LFGFEWTVDSREEVEKQLKAMKLMSMLDKHSTGIELSGKNKKDLGEHKVNLCYLPPLRERRKREGCSRLTPFISACPE